MQAFTSMNGKAALLRLEELELFRSLPDAALTTVRAAMQVDRVASGSVVFEQGERASRAFALGSGSIRISQTGQEGGQAIVRFIAPGEMFGTVPLFTDHLFPANAITAESSVILSWSEQGLVDLMTSYPAIALNVIHVLGTRLGEAQERMRELATLRAEQRLAQAILRLAAQAGSNCPEGTAITIPLRRKDIAEYAGTTLYTASRTLATWEKAGVLTSRGQYITVRDLGAMRGIGDTGTD
ncbi:Crp/Fnr family transcriptional regulator [Rhizorhapis sp. SPR117]|uniref:Crp/Fnr family transcriptional regulator n=1 Tax=Rhizorhapis sp. SPR117 TaxID=2912611 RepID=UPI001F1DB2A3|nr:Crp/Fnr family transcriptional regulator [Rhizorhapis sp. SPR117]